MKFTLKRLSLTLVFSLAAPLVVSCTDDEPAPAIPRGQVEVIYSDLCIDCEDEALEQPAEPALADCPPPCGPDRRGLTDGACSGCQDS